MAVRDTLITDLQLVGLGVYTSGFFSIARSIERAADRLEDFNSKQVLFAAGGALVATKTLRFLKEATLEAGNLQAKQQAFTTLFRGNAGAADQFIASLQKFALTSSFTFNQTADLTQQLVAMGFAADETIPIMQRLGDAASALGGDPQKLDRLVLAIGQIRTRGKLVQQELNQLSQAGFPVADLLDRMGLSNVEKGNIGRAGIESGRALKAIFDLIDERMGGSMQRRLETIPGQIDQIRDAWEGVLRVTGQIPASLALPVMKQISSVLMSIAQSPGAGAIISGGAAFAGAAGLAAFGRTGWNIWKQLQGMKEEPGGRAGGVLRRIGGRLAEGAAGAIGTMNVTAAVVNVFGGGGIPGVSGGGGATGASRTAASAAAARAAASAAAPASVATTIGMASRMRALPGATRATLLNAQAAEILAANAIPGIAAGVPTRGASAISILHAADAQRNLHRLAMSQERFMAGGGLGMGAPYGMTNPILGPPAPNSAFPLRTRMGRFAMGGLGRTLIGGVGTAGGMAIRDMASEQDSFAGIVAGDALTGASLGFGLGGLPGAAIGGIAGTIAGMFDASITEHLKGKGEEAKLAAGADKDMMDALNKIANNTENLRDFKPNAFRIAAGGRDVYRPLPGALASIISNAKI